MKTSRRNFIIGASAITGGAFLSFGNFSRPPPPLLVLNKHKNQLLSKIVDMIIPETDTPGALAAGVPAYINMIFNDWFDSSDREQFLIGLNDVDHRSSSTDFLVAPKDEQLAILQQLDNQDQNGYNFFHHLKKLTLKGYYTSEIGATKELRYAAIPGPYRGCVPLEEIGRTWAT